MKRKIAAGIALVATGAAIAVGTQALTTTSGAKVWNVTPSSTPSLATAEAQAQPGDTVVLTGTWRNTSLVPAVSGTATAPITYQAGTGGATFDATGMTAALASISRSYITVSGITFTNATDHILRPAANRGVIVRGSHNTFTGDSFVWMTMQLIGASYNTISNNNWRYYVASYVKDNTGVYQPQTSGDMLYIVANSITHVGSSNNTITGNDMKYAGHSLIEVGNGFAWGASTNNTISNNTLSNPWYRCIALADDGSGTVVDGNMIADSNSVPALYSTVAGKVGQLNTASNAIQIIGQGFTVSNNTIKNSVSAYGAINLIAEYYTQAGITYRDEARGNTISGNTITGNKGAAAISFVVYRASTDPVGTPNLTGNAVSNNIISGNTTSTSKQQGMGGYATFAYHAASYAVPWVGINGNTINGNAVDPPGTAAYHLNTTYAGVPTNRVYTLAQFNTLDPGVYGNVVAP